MYCDDIPRSNKEKYFDALGNTSSIRAKVVTGHTNIIYRESS